MAGPVLNLRFDYNAEDQISTLGEVDRRRVLGLCNEIRNWHNDEVVRKLARPIATFKDEYVFRTNSDWVIGFHLGAEDVTIMSIFRKDTNRAFEAAAQGSK